MSLLKYFKKLPNTRINNSKAASADEIENLHECNSKASKKREIESIENGSELKKAKLSDANENGSEMPKNSPVDIPPYLALEKSNMRPDWFQTFLPEMKKPYFRDIKLFLEQEKNRKVVVYPPEADIYTFAKYPLSDIKVVIIGQDPYHNPNQAHGLCFSVKAGVSPPPSLINIYKELVDDLGPEHFKVPKHGYLEGWSKQGVLLLNASLTVRANSPASHSSIGWQTFTDAIIKYIDKNCNNVVFLLWGRHAQIKAAGVNLKKHLVLKAVHPSPLSAHRGFFGCKHFSKCNEYLSKHGLEPINWNDLDLPKSI